MNNHLEKNIEVAIKYANECIGQDRTWKMEQEWTKFFHYKMIERRYYYSGECTLACLEKGLKEHSVGCGYKFRG